MSEYGDGCAEFYDAVYGAANPNAVRALARLAGGGSVLELGIGTGRTALALRERVARLVGIESSPAMRARLAAKPGAAALAVVAGDFSRVRLAERFDLIYALVDTFFLLEGRDAQRRCLAHMRRMLSAHGVFVIETYAPCPGDAVAVDGALTYQRTVDTPRGARRYEARLYPRDLAELDALAAAAGLSLRERWADWQGTPYAAPAPMQVSIYAACARQPADDAGAQWPVAVADAVVA